MWSKEKKCILSISRDACCFLSRRINILPYIFTCSCPLATPQSSPGCDKIFLRTEPTIPWGFNVSGQPWALLNFYKNLLGKDRNSSPGNGSIHILSLQKQNPKQYSRMEAFSSIDREIYYYIFWKVAFVYKHFLHVTKLKTLIKQHHMQRLSNIGN